MSLVELKQAARDHKPPIKRYYIKSRLELIQLLSLKELPESLVLEKKTIAELRKEAIARGHTHIWKLKKAELLELLYPRAYQHNQNNDHTKKHDDPKQSKSE
jgi:hypothetical protein